MKLHAITKILASAMHSVTSIAAIASAAIAVLPGIARADGETQEFRLEHFKTSAFTKFTCGWNYSPKVDQTIANIGTKLKVLVDGTATEFEHGFGAHADSEIVFPLDGNGVSFSARVGVDLEKEGNGSVMFYVYGIKGGTETELWKSSKVLAGSDNSETTGVIDISGYDSLKLFADDDGDNADDHADWIDPKIVMKSDVSVDGLHVVDYSQASSIASADVAKGVLLINAGTTFMGAVAIGANGAIAVDMTGSVSTETQADTVIPLFSASSVSLPEAEAIVDSVVLVGPVVDYTIALQVDGSRTSVYATITDASQASASRKVCVWTGASTHWNNESGNWTSLPTKGGPDIGVFCEDAAVDYNGGNADWIVYYDEMILRGAKVSFTKTDNVVDLPMKHIGGVGKLTVDSLTISSCEGRSLRVDENIVLVLKGNGTLTPVTGENKVAISGVLKLTEGENSLAYWNDVCAHIEVSGGAFVFPAVESGVTSFDLPAKVKVAESSIYFVEPKVEGSTDTWEMAVSEGKVIVRVQSETDASLNYWIGGASGDWSTPGNWKLGVVPTSEHTVLFGSSADVAITNDNNYVKSIVVNDEAKVVLRNASGNYFGWDGQFSLWYERISGKGTLGLDKIALKSSLSEGNAVIDCAEIEVMLHHMDVDKYASIIWGSDQSNTSDVEVHSDITGAGFLKLRFGVRLYGDNSRHTGGIQTISVGHNYNGNVGETYFCTPQSGFPSASSCEFQGRFHVLFTEGTIKFGKVDWHENYGKGVYMPYGTTGVTIEVGEGTVHDEYQGSGYGVYTRAEGSLSVDGATAGCANLTIKKVGEGTLVYGVTKEHNFVIAEGRVEFTGENDNSDDADVDVTVKAGASIGSAAAFSHENPNWTLGGDVTVRHQFTFEPGAAIKQEYIATTTTDEQTQVETTTYSMRKLTIADDVDLANVVFGVTNPEDLPAVTRASLADLPRFTMFAANSLSGAVATENGGYAPEGSEKNGSWIARPSRTAANAVEFRPYIRSGLVVIIK